LENLKTDTLIAKTVAGLEPVLAAELSALNANDVIPINRAVSFSGDMAMLYRANYCCRTALRILKPLFQFKLAEQKDLYENLHAFAWEDVLWPDCTISIDAVISYTVFTNSQFVAQKSKDAIVDRIREKSGRRPSVSLDNPDFRINVHLFRDTCTVSLDSSGQSLHKRGYRRSTGQAPINEVLASGLIQLSGWDRVQPLIDPMCGSGTLLIEAAMLARNTPAGLFREEFGFMKWRGFDADLWAEVRASAMALRREDAPLLIGMDKLDRAIKSAQENCRYSGLSGIVDFQVMPFEESQPPVKEGVIITNPPYDERIKLDDSIAFYKMIGNVLKQKYAGYTAWVISSDLDALKFIGLKPSKKITVFNGPLECRFVKFDLFAGKRGASQ